MNDATQKRYINAKRIGRAHGLKHEAEDFAGWIVARWLEGKSLRQDLEHSYVDYMRETRGDSRRPPTTIQTVRMPHAWWGTVTTDSETQNRKHHPPSKEFERLVNARIPLTDKDSRINRAIFVLYFMWELTLKEIGFLFGVSEGRISQRIREIIRKTKVVEE